MNQYIEEIENSLNQFPKRTSKQNPESYIGGGQSKLKYIGLKVPHLRTSFQMGYSFSKSPPEEVAEIFDYVWKNSDCYEVMSIALSWYYQPKNAQHLQKFWPRLKNWSERIDNWAHADTLCGIYARILEQNPAKVYPALKTWNRSKNPWLRRMSLVSLLCYSSQREKVLPFQKMISLVQALLHDEHYYVQKGVGWALRELGNVYPKETYRFLEKHIHEISSIAFSAATEKLEPRKKSRLKAMRKKRELKFGTRRSGG